MVIRRLHVAGAFPFIPSPCNRAAQAALTGNHNNMRVLCFDVESNGLHGQAFAVGGVVYDTETQASLDTLLVRCPIEGDVNEWVAENVLQHLDIAETHTDAKAMRSAFWTWFQQHKQNAVILVDVGYPVETRFLAQCQDDDVSRAWDGPYPLHDLASVLLALGLDPDLDRRVGHIEQHLRQHHPLDDALASVLVFDKVFRERTP